MSRADVTHARSRRGRPGPVLLTAAALLLPALGLGATAAPAGATVAGRHTLPSPNVYDTQGTPQPLSAAQQISLRVYLAGQNTAGVPSAVPGVSVPGTAGPGHFLTPAQYQRRFGPSAARFAAVSHWLTGAGMKITGETSRYITVQASVAQADTAFDTTISEYIVTIPGNGKSGPYSYVSSVGTTGTLSVPAALGADIATVTGIDQAIPSGNGIAAEAAARGPAVKSTVASSQGAGYQCSRYWGQHSAKIPAAYGRTTAPTQLCGYTPGQLRTAYGITGSPYTGKGATIAIVLPNAWPTMLTDANRFFASQGIAGFAPGQFTVSRGSRFASTCGAEQQAQDLVPGPEHALDVETTHIAAPDAKVVFAAADCVPLSENNPPLELQNLLDATTRVVVHHLADVITSSWGYGGNAYSPADVAAWNLTFQQGALEGITFDYASGDGGSPGPEGGLSTSAQFPAADPWVTAVGGTSLAIGENGTAVADYPWGDSIAQANAAGTGYTAALPGDFLSGSGGGVSAWFAQPGYQRPVVPATLATDSGRAAPRRVVPDISANAGSNWLIGYTGAVTTGAYGQVLCGGTSGSTPLIAGLEADAIQAAGHPLGFANPLLYRLYRTPAIRVVSPVSTTHPPVLYGTTIYANGGNFLTTIGEDQPPLRAAAGYDDVTGLGAVTPSFVTALRQAG